MSKASLAHWCWVTYLGSHVLIALTPHRLGIMNSSYLSRHLGILKYLFVHIGSVYTQFESRKMSSLNGRLLFFNKSQVPVQYIYMYIYYLYLAVFHRMDMFIVVWNIEYLLLFLFRNYQYSIYWKGSTRVYLTTRKYISQITMEYGFTCLLSIWLYVFSIKKLFQRENIWEEKIIDTTWVMNKDMNKGKQLI